MTCASFKLNKASKRYYKVLKCFENSVTKHNTHQTITNMRNRTETDNWFAQQANRNRKVKTKVINESRKSNKKSGEENRIVTWLSKSIKACFVAWLLLKQVKLLYWHCHGGVQNACKYETNEKHYWKENNLNKLKQRKMVFSY